MNTIYILVVILVVALLFVTLFKPSKKQLRIKRASKMKNQAKQINIKVADNVLSVVLNIIYTNQNNLPAVFAYLRKIEPFVFEELLLTCFERQGFKIVRNTRYTGDGGIDGKVYIDGGLYLIQAKRYSGSIKLSHLEEFSSTIKSNRSVGGYFIHTGTTGTGCRSYLDQHPSIQLISGQRLIEFIKLSAR
jgi:restriction system protein